MEFSGHLSRRELYRLLEFISFCRSAKEEGGAVGALEKLREIVPFRAGIIGRLDSPNGKLRRTLHTASVGFAPAYLRSYAEHRFALVDPLIAHGMDTDRPFTWKEVLPSSSRTQTSSQVRHLLELSADYGLNAGVAYALRSAPQEREVLYMCLETGCEPVTKAHIEALQFALPHLQDLLRPGQVAVAECQVPGLSAREREVLRWLKEGKSAWEIGVILSISEHTVKFHLGNIYAKLNVTGRAQAVARALQQGLIDLG